MGGGGMGGGGGMSGGMGGSGGVSRDSSQPFVVEKKEERYAFIPSLLPLLHPPLSFLPFHPKKIKKLMLIKGLHHHPTRDHRRAWYSAARRTRRVPWHRC